MTPPISIVTNEDNMLMMARYPDKYFDLAVVDPQYGISINHNIGRRKNDKKSNHKKVTWDSEIPKNDYFNELFRVSKNQIIWGENYFPILWENGCKSFLIWDKLFSPEVTFSMYELAWTSFNTTPKGFIYSPQKDLNKIHPTQKPVALYSWIFSNYAKPGYKILDTHLGSQNSRIAAYKKGFDFYGCELDPDYFNDGNEHFAKEIAMPIFDTPIETSIQLTLL